MHDTHTRMPRRVVIFATAAILALAAVAGGAFAIASGGEAESRVAHMRGAVDGVDSRLGDEFGIFRSDELKVANAGPTNAQNPFGQNTALSRAVPVERGGAVYVIPGDGAVCLGDKINWGHTCVDIATAITGDLYLVTLGDPKTPYTTVSGLAPDDVSEVSIELASGKAVTVPVHHNVYDFSMPGDGPPVTGISWTSNVGESHRVNLPDGGVQRPSIPDEAPTG